MTERRDLPQIVEAAEQAAAGGDYASAERHLRAAIARQEATLGPRHPDLANTLNNLGVVCERAGNTVEAEHSYRQAYAVARAALPPEHPFVVTSARNLREFCEASRRPFELPTPASTVPSRVELPARTQARTPDRSPPAEPGRPSLPISVRSLAIIGAVGLALIWLTVNGPLRTRPDVARSATGVTPAAAEGPALATATASAATAPTNEGPAPAAATAPRGRAVESPGVPTISRPGDLASRAGLGRPVAAATSVSVARAQVCRGLSTRASNGPDWPCDQVRGSVSAGTLFFYTRLTSPKPTTVLHRWYRGDSLQQVVQLSVNANPDPGYRTYSRLTISPERAGDWRVELRTTDGILLRNESFVVR
jgi:Protein of unknown function (DUF2914)/Tetratricopeptide repeat